MVKMFKVYKKDEASRLKTAMITMDYNEACKKEKELQDKGFEAFVWQV